MFRHSRVYLLIFALVLPVLTQTAELKGASSADCIAAALSETAQQRNFETYSAGMNKTMQEKVALVERWLPRNKSNPLVIDVGTGTGGLASALAEKYDGAEVLGVDLSPEMLSIATAQNKPRANLSFRLSQANKPFAANADVAVFSSIVHEIYSYSGDSMATVADSMRTAFNSLGRGGRIVVRDFIKPANAHRKVLLTQLKSDIVQGHTIEDFASKFGRPVPLRKVEESSKKITYETNLESAYEYIYRKDYHDNWDVELKEKYGVWTAQEARSIVQSAGFKVVHVEELDNPWITENRLKNKIALVDAATNEKLEFPKYQMLIVGEKPNPSVAITTPKEVERLLEARISSTRPPERVVQDAPQPVKVFDDLLAFAKGRIADINRKLQAPTLPVNENRFLKQLLERTQLDVEVLQAEREYNLALQGWKDAEASRRAARNLADNDLELIRRRNHSRTQSIKVIETKLKLSKAQLKHSKLWANESEARDLILDHEYGTVYLNRELARLQRQTIEQMLRSEQNKGNTHELTALSKQLADAYRRERYLSEKVSEVGHRTLEIRKNDDDALDNLRRFTSGKVKPPRGARYQGQVYRSGSWTIHQGNVGANQRYSKPGTGTLYTSTLPPTVRAELTHYGVALDTALVEPKEISVENILDLTDSGTRSMLGISLAQLIRDDYFLTQVLGELAQSLGYNGIRAPSARLPGGEHLLLFESQ